MKFRQWRWCRVCVPHYGIKDKRTTHNRLFHQTLFQYHCRIPSPYPHYVRGIWKRRFHSENPSNVFCPHYAGALRRICKSNNHRSFSICVWGKLRQENHKIIVTPSLSKSFSVFKLFSVHTETKSRRFRFEERFEDGRPNRKYTWSAFSNFSGAAWTGPKSRGHTVFKLIDSCLLRFFSVTISGLTLVTF